jgi:hypothetical protein
MMSPNIFASELRRVKDCTDHHIGQRVLRVAGELAVQALHLLLRLLRPVDHQRGEDGEDHDEDDEQAAQAPVHGERQRQQHHHAHQRGQVLAEEGQPDAEQVVGAAQHHLHQPARLHVAMEFERQGQHVLEVAAHHHQPVAVRHAVAEQGGGHIGHDPRQPDRRPDAEQHEGLAPHHLRRQEVRLGEQVHHLAEQHRLQELEPGEGDGGGGEAHRHPAIGLQQASTRQ